MENDKSEKVGKVVEEFYEKFGWVEDGNKSGEDIAFREFCDTHRDYYSAFTRAREQAQFEGLNGHLLFAGGGDLPNSHLTIAKNFNQLTCVDFSKKALQKSEEKLGSKSNYVHASLLDIPLESGSIDAVFCSHVIYHIEADSQAQAVNELLRITKQKGKVVIVYSNPRTPLLIMEKIIRSPKIIYQKIFGKKKKNESNQNGVAMPSLYFKPLPLSFWKQFESQATVTINPWQVLRLSQERRYIKSEKRANSFYSWAAKFEEKHPKLAVRLWSYPIITLEVK